MKPEDGEVFTEELQQERKESLVTCLVDYCTAQVLDDALGNSDEFNENVVEQRERDNENKKTKSIATAALVIACIGFATLVFMLVARHRRNKRNAPLSSSENM